MGERAKSPAIMGGRGGDLGTLLYPRCIAVSGKVWALLCDLEGVKSAGR